MGTKHFILSSNYGFETLFRSLLLCEIAMTERHLHLIVSYQCNFFIKMHLVAFEYATFQQYVRM